MLIASVVRSRRCTLTAWRLASRKPLGCLSRLAASALGVSRGRGYRDNDRSSFGAADEGNKEARAARLSRRALSFRIVAYFFSR